MRQLFTQKVKYTNSLIIHSSCHIDLRWTQKKLKYLKMVLFNDFLNLCIIDATIFSLIEDAEQRQLSPVSHFSLFSNSSASLLPIIHCQKSSERPWKKKRKLSLRIPFHTKILISFFYEKNWLCLVSWKFVVKQTSVAFRTDSKIFSFSFITNAEYERFFFQTNIIYFSIGDQSCGTYRVVQKSWDSVFSWLFSCCW